MQKLRLPEWAFLDTHSYLENQLHGRTVVIYSSMIVIKIIETDNSFVK